MFSRFVLSGCAVALALISFCAAPLQAAEKESFGDMVMKAKVAYRQGKLADALLLISKTIDAYPDQKEGYMLRGQLYGFQRKNDKAIEDYTRAIQLDANYIDAWQKRGESYFCEAKITESLSDFDQYLKLKPAAAPYHWQRGIALYYAKRYEDGRKQFELHQTVNKNDVENAVWHFLCVTRQEGLEKARKALIPIVGDSRVPMMQIYALYAGKGTVEEVMKAAGEGTPGSAGLREQLFYASLYLGLYYDAQGDELTARKYLLKATGDYSEDDYMGEVARVHAKFLREKAAEPKK